MSYLGTQVRLKKESPSFPAAFKPGPEGQWSGMEKLPASVAVSSGRPHPLAVEEVA